MILECLDIIFNRLRADFQEAKARGDVQAMQAINCRMQQIATAYVRSAK